MSKGLKEVRDKHEDELRAHQEEKEMPCIPQVQTRCPTLAISSSDQLSEGGVITIIL